jgi:glycosyltransferase involved in cell wall biosynthesis
MKILFVGKRYYTNRDALSERYGRIFQLPRFWHEAGFDVRLWLIDYHRGREKGKDAGARAQQALPIDCLPLPGLAIIGKILSLLLTGRDRPRFVVASGDCYIGLLCWMLARLSGARFVFDIYDRYDQFPAYLRLPGFDLLGFLRSRADVCLFASELVPEQLGGRCDKDIIVPNGLDTDRFRPLDLEQCRQQAGIEGEQYLVGYFGSMEPDRGVADLVGAIGLLVDQGLEVRLLIGGHTTDPQLLDRPYVNYLGNRPFADMPVLMGCCQVLALPYRRSTFMDAGASNKIAEYIAVGRPVAATRSPNLLANFNFGNGGDAELAQPSDPNSLAVVIRSCIQSPRKLQLPPGMTWREIAQDTIEQIRTMTFK